ncbi:glutaredoxin [Synechococcus phage S-PM2]|uniref:Glutaredoxin n=1 Tax=Synechococcus phage S-PM2 TaxID=238854 RepID=Q5GQH5_BPSYP|nr:glutaredoxin [Synechococcus phage S-PM2]CAF34227.1 glutaredoxin [Synechococcus phage S-PM2]CFW42362.1 glutaredoxin [Synechococcus phage S-PM2]
MTFTIYSKEGCPYCEKFVAIVEYEELSHVVYELGKDFTKEEFYAEFGEGSTFPQIVLDDLHLGGCVDSIKYLQENNICCVV